jgi:predicted Fe-Mo cluster-binding NifX family protein
MLCFPTTNDAGLGARLSPHFGSAPFFTFVDATTGSTTVTANAHARHEHGRCRPTRGLEGRGVEAVVCHGLGRRALEKLTAAGIPVFVTGTWGVAEAVKEYREGRLSRLTPEEACPGGRHADLVHG